MKFVILTKIKIKMILLYSLLIFDAAVKKQLGFQTPATEVMDNIIDLHHDIFSIMLVIATVVFYIMIITIYKFHSKNFKTPRMFSFTHDTSLEIMWTIIPIIILIFILIPSFVLLYGMDETRNAQVTIKVIGRQWYWTYEIPITVKNNEKADESIYSVKTLIFDSYMLPIEELPLGSFRLLEVDNILKLPVDTNIRVLVTATDVLHSWAIPSFGIKIDACPGRLNQVWLNVYRFGVFYGQCSEICGINHGFMPISIETITYRSFEKHTLTTL
jgi:cytochrome c oxidase subunit II